MENKGWVKLFRSLLDWQWYKNTNTKIVFIHLLLKVNYENKKWQGVDIPRGSYITSYKHIAEELGLTIQKVRSALTNLKSTHEITIKSTNKYTRITIENWEKYQGEEFENNTQNNKQTNNQITNKQQQLKNIKNIKNNNINILNKYIKGNQIPQELFAKRKLIKEIKENEDLTPELEKEIEDYILGVK